MTRLAAVADEEAGPGGDADEAAEGRVRIGRTHGINLARRVARAAEHVEGRLAAKRAGVAAAHQHAAAPAALARGAQ